MDYARGCQDDIHAPKPEERISRQHIRDLYALPLPELLFRAQAVHRQHFDPTKIQMATLVSIKTGACVEDCGYCAQSARHKAADYEPLMQIQEVLEKAREAKESGSVRLCMGAAWREIKDGPEFDRVLSMVRGVREMGLEACCTLGMLTEDQAKRLADAGLTAYNHNLDTSPEYYSQIITTRTFEDRLRTLEAVRKAGVQICSGGILGLGESREDRVGLLHELANLPAPPDSVPINRLMAMKGTPLQDAEPIDDIEVVRTIAVARILMPASRVRLSAGRVEMPPAVQFLCFFAGANSMFAGEKLLTAANPCASDDLAMLASFGMSGESVVEEVGQHH